MRLVIQRVENCLVEVDEEKRISGKIGKGLFVMVGIGKDDKKGDAQKLAEKLAKLRIMADENGKMNLSIADVKAKVLAVSQFTLYADTKAGNRPSFIDAKNPKDANEIYRYFIKSLNEKGVETEEGVFGSYMKIENTLDGPVTIIMES